MPLARPLSFLLLASVAFAASAGATTIDFELLSPGDGLAQVNALTSPLGATFDASTPGQANGGPFTVTDLSGNNVITSGGWPADADVLVNFSTPMAFVQVTFVDNPDIVGAATYIGAFDKNGTADGILDDPTANLIGSSTGVEPTVLSITQPGIRSLQIESASGVLYFDTIVFSPIPEPGTSVLLALGLAGLGFGSRRLRRGAAAWRRS